MSDGAAATPRNPEAQSASISSEKVISQATPMMRQYLEVKSRYPDTILFFRLGDFYEMFFDDAIEASKILQITLTARSKGDEKVPMCGVPYHAARGHIAKLVEAGLKVALCDQVEEPGKSGSIVRREVSRVITPGMVLDEDLLDAHSNNYLCAIALSAQGGGLALLDASTGEFFAGEVGTDAGLASEILRAGAKEVLVAASEMGSDRIQELIRACPGIVVNPFLDEAFDSSRAESYLHQHFGTRNLEGFGLGGMARAVAAAGASLRYLKETQPSEATHVDRVGVHLPCSAMVLDSASRANLEIVRTLRDGKRKGSLLGLLDKSATAMGSRRLTRWLSYPLLELLEIERRLDAVEELSQKGVLREELYLLLREVSDLERLTARLSLGQGNARDLRAMANSLQKLPQVAQRMEECASLLLKSLGPALRGLSEFEREIDRAVALEPPATLKEGGFIREGFHAELDRLVAISTQGKDFLLQLEAKERERTKIGSLKIRYNRVFGYFLEVTRANLHLVPADYIRKQTTAGGERFVTAELKEFEEQVLTAEERRYALECELFEQLRAQVVACAVGLRSAADAIATVDVLMSLGRVAAEYGYVRPVVDDSSNLEIVDGRHPVVERMLEGESFVPNSIQLDRSRSQVLVITGPNMAGKSTVMRQVALLTLMAQSGSFVPAKSARIGRCDRIFTRVGAADNLSRGQSTFMVEMTETASILHNASEKSLIILDEIGRGTSTFDGLSIAWAVAEHIHDVVGARTLFATHYHELTDLAREKNRVQNVSIAVKEWQGKVVFLRKLVSGGASRSYGIEVARLAGLPSEVLHRARQILTNLEKAEFDELGKPSLSRGKRRENPAQLGLFSRKEEPPSIASKNSAIFEELKKIDLNQITPLEALQYLNNLKSKLL